MKTLYFLSFILCISCADHKKADDRIVFKRADQIEHYQLNISDKDLHTILRSENLSMEERRLAEILHHNDPATVNDSLFIAEMDAAPYFTKKPVDKKNNSKIVEAFIAKKPLMSASFQPVRKLCAPTYRDILIFRRNSKITGFAKLCFDCNHAYLVGEQSETNDIMTDYDSLREILADEDQLVMDDKKLL